MRVKKRRGVIVQTWRFIIPGLANTTVCLRTAPRFLHQSICSSLLVIVSLLVGSAWGQQAVVHETFPEVVPAGARAQARSVPVPISLGADAAFREGLNVHAFATLSEEEIAAADSAAEKHPRPLRVGLVRSVGEVPLSIEHGSALQTQSPEGETKWTLAIRSAGAFGIRLHFSNFDVGGGSVVVYARRDEADVIVRGPYTGKGPRDSGDFWTASLPGEIVFIEASGTDEPEFEVAEFLHFDKDLAGPAPLAALDCHVDVMCRSSSVHSAVRDATGWMNFVEGGEGKGCTGTILNDLDPDTYMGYFITARHCISSQAVADTLEVVWLWQKDSCNGSLPDYPDLPRSDPGSATLLHTNSDNDMTFMRLSGGIPGGTAAGWTTGHPSSAYGVHHPGGDYKRVTFLSDVGFCPGCEFCGSGGNYDHYDMDEGVIEDGSSGSGVFNSSGQLAGQLEGHCCLYASCADEEPSCGNKDEMTAYYGEFEETYPIIRRWLEIGGTIHVDGSYVGRELGTASQPFDTVTEGYDFAWDGARIKISAGSYPEALTMSKQLTLLADGGTVVIGP